MDSLDAIAARNLGREDAPPPLKQVLWYQCDDCFDSGLLWHKANGPALCLPCGERTDLSAAAARLQRVVFDRVASNTVINKQHYDLARALVKSTPTLTVPLNILIRQFGLTDRTIKGYIESLRADWCLPIGSSKFPPSGYYWINTAEEFKAWVESFLTQPKEEFRTAYRMMRNNFGELAGQINFDFEEVK